MTNGETEKHEIVEDAPITQVITEEFIAKFEKQAELYQEKYLPICLKLTNENDWVSHAEGKFYLQASGAEKICNPLSIVWGAPIPVKHERHDDKGDFYEYEMSGIVESKVLRRYIWTTGNCSSRDQFFNARGSFDEGDIRKAAYSNFIVNGVTRLAGIRNPSKAMLEKAGLKPDQIKKIDYSGAAKSAQAADSVVSEPQIKRLLAIAKGKGVTEEKLAQALCEYYNYIVPDPTKAGIWPLAQQLKRRDYDSFVAFAERGGVALRQPGQEG